MTKFFEGVQRVVFAHAHPDDETLATGALIQHLTGQGLSVAVVTATRGERGAVVPGPLSALAGTPELEPHRIGELSDALTALGAQGPFFLGEPPALATGRAPRRYQDSGMVWVTETVAGPGDDAGPDAFTSAPVAEAPPVLSLNGTPHPLDKERVVIGRSKDSDIRTEDPNASRRHAEVRHEDGAYWLVDLDSTNGVAVNGRRTKRQRLNEGDTITIGSTDLVFGRSGE